MGDYPNVLGANVIWVLVIFGWTFAMMVPFFYVLKLCGLLRISPEEEEVCPTSTPAHMRSSRLESLNPESWGRTSSGMPCWAGQTAIMELLCKR